MSEYIIMPENSIYITEEQAIAIYNIHQVKSTKSFQEVLENSGDLCITCDGDPNVRLANAKILQKALGEDIFDAREVLKDLKTKSFLV